MLKQISLAALAATFITGSAAVAHAESKISDVSPPLTSSAGLRADWSDATISVWGPSDSMNAYGYVRERRLDRVSPARPNQRPNELQ